MAQTDPEIAFCELICLEPNKKGKYIYISEKGSSIIDMIYILNRYEKYLQDKKQLEKWNSSTPTWTVSTTW